MTKASWGGELSFRRTRGKKIEGGIKIFTSRQGGANPSTHYEGPTPIYKNETLLETTTLIKLKRRYTLALGPRKFQIFVRRQNPTIIEMQKRSYSMIALRYWNALVPCLYGFKHLFQTALIILEKQPLLWINLYLERLTSALSANHSPVFRDKSPNLHPHDGLKALSLPTRVWRVELWSLMGQVAKW